MLENTSAWGREAGVGSYSCIALCIERVTVNEGRGLYHMNTPSLFLLDEQVDSGYRIIAANFPSDTTRPFIQQDIRLFGVGHSYV